ncbi:hypothetical protein HA402_009251 [Bradysia odoriphaga]|nr:hypothetical protein HA402_009251 [Bradysia odoriphaga]
MTQIISLRKTILVKRTFVMESIQRKIKYKLQVIKGLVKRFKVLNVDDVDADAKQIELFLTLLDDINGTPVDDVVDFHIELQDVKDYLEDEMMHLLNLLELNGSRIRERCIAFQWRSLFDLLPEAPVRTTLSTPTNSDSGDGSIDLSDKTEAKEKIKKEEVEGGGVVGGCMGPESEMDVGNEAGGSGGM